MPNHHFSLSQLTAPPDGQPLLGVMAVAGPGLHPHEAKLLPIGLVKQNVHIGSVERICSLRMHTGLHGSHSHSC